MATHNPFIKTNAPNNKAKILNASPPIILAGGFMGLIILGTIFLAMPFAASNEPIGLFNAFFMAASAVTVTGLSIIDTSADLNLIGKSILIILVQLGGLGFVTFAVLTSLALGRKLSLKQQAVALQAFNQTNVSHIKDTAVIVIKVTLVIEAIAALGLALWWWRTMPFDTALIQGIFHAIAGFNNSGFAFFDGSLNSFNNDAVTILTIAFLIIFGGIGFSIIHDISEQRKWSKLMPYTKIVLIGTLFLNLFGFIAFLLIEMNNNATIGNLPWHGKILSAFFQSITTRTAGFTTFDVSQMRDSSTLISLVLMFIGGGSLSTASGIKVGTFMVIMAAMWSYITQRHEIVLMKRSIELETIQKSLSLIVISGIFIVFGVFVLTLLETKPFIDLLFEVVSALTTTGMTRNTTPELSTASQTIIIILMFAGRLGPLTLVYSLATRKSSRIRYPVANFPVG